MAPVSPFAFDHDGSPSPLAAAIAVAAAGLLLCAVAIANGFPLIWMDTRAYYMAGKTAIERGLPILMGLFADSGGSSGEVRQVEEAVRDVTAVRSAYYGGLIYLLSALHSLWLVVVAQGLVVAYVVLAFCRVTVGHGTVPVFLATVTGLTLFTSLPWYTAQIMPDVFAGVTILCVALLAFYGDRFGRLETLALAAILFASLTFHNTHLLVAVGLLVIVLAAKLLEGRRPGEVAATGALLAAPVALAVAAGLFVSYVGFRELTLTPQNPPFLLARSVGDGPGKAYLEEHCPELDYAVCEFVGRLATDTEVFLWSVEDGVYAAASPETRERLRAEESAVVLAAAREHPLWQLRASLRNWLSQLGMFGITDVRTDTRARIDGDGLVAVWGDHDEDEGLLRALSVVHYLAAGLSLATIVAAAPLWWRGGAGRDDAARRLRGVIGAVVAGLLINALLCGVLSLPTHRYQARVVWLLPLVAVPLAVAAVRARRRRAAAQRPGGAGRVPRRPAAGPLLREQGLDKA